MGELSKRAKTCHVTSINKDLMEPFNTLSNTIIFKNRNGTLVKTTIDEYTPIYVHSAYSIGTINGLAYVGPSQYLTQQ